MTAILLDFSQRRELELHGRIVADVEAVVSPLGIPVLIAGAFARDLHLLYRYEIDTQRETADVDFALAVPDWAAFEQLRENLVASEAFRATTNPIRLRHVSDLPVDLVPFGRVERKDRTVALPPRGELVMDVFGFREALASADVLILPPDVRSKVVSLPALAMLKLVCWQDRHYRSPMKDAVDLRLIVANYLQAGNEDRLWDEFVDWTQEDGFDYESAGARMLGHDIRALLDPQGIARVASLLAEQADESTPARLPAEMNRHDPDRARRMLDAVLSGLLEER